MPFVAISIDLCGSTHVKQRIAQIAGDRKDRRGRLFSDYKRLLFDIERNFYALALKAPEIDFKRLSLIKSIGDEFWFAYKIDEIATDAGIHAIRRIIFTLLDLLAQERILALDQDDDFAPASASSYFDLPIKIYADIVDGYDELNRERYEHLKQIVADASGDTSPVIEVDETYLEICDRLNLGVPDDDGTHHAVRAREDFIGLEIDRFFRMSKLCVPRLLGLGLTLFEYTGWPILPSAVDLEHLDIKVVAAARTERGHDETIYAVERPVRGHEMKGIHEDYMMFHLFDKTSLGEYFEAPSPLIDSLMGPTRAYLAEKGFFAVLNHTHAAAI